MRGHYHCLRAGCYFVTNITTKLPWHLKKHEKAERRAANGFKYFTKREECGRLGTAPRGAAADVRQGLGQLDSRGRAWGAPGPAQPPSKAGLSSSLSVTGRAPGPSARPRASRSHGPGSVGLETDKTQAQGPGKG